MPLVKLHATIPWFCRHAPPHAHTHTKKKIMEKPYFASDDLRFPAQTREDIHLGIVRQTRGINSKNASKELRSCHERVRESRALQSVREQKQK